MKVKIKEEVEEILIKKESEKESELCKFYRIKQRSLLSYTNKVALRKVKL